MVVVYVWIAHIPVLIVPWIHGCGMLVLPAPLMSSVFYFSFFNQFLSAKVYLARYGHYKRVYINKHHIHCECDFPMFSMISCGISCSFTHIFLCSICCFPFKQYDVWSENVFCPENFLCDFFLVVVLGSSSSGGIVPFLLSSETCFISFLVGFFPSVTVSKTIPSLDLLLMMLYLLPLGLRQEKWFGLQSYRKDLVRCISRLWRT